MRDTSEVHEISLHNVGLMDYCDCWQAMRNKAGEIAQTHQHEIWLVNHPPVFTLGQAGNTVHLLSVAEDELVRTDRGGQVTWHGPGQIIVYVLLHLPSLGIGPKVLVSLLEQTVLDTLASYGIAGDRRKGAPGIYVAEAKIASVGLRIHKGVSYHGIAFNHSNDLAPFSRINPCGFEGLRVTRLIDLVDVSLDACAKQLSSRLVELLRG